MSKARKKITVLAAAVFTAICLIFVPMAFAADGVMTITQKAADGGTNPASTIIIADQSGNTVKSISYAGGSATIDPVSLPTGYYTVTAQADGYLFNKQGGQFTEQGATISLLAYHPIAISITVQGNGVTDYSGVGIKMYKGSSTTGEAKASGTCDTSGNLVFENQIPGDYTLVLDIPTSLSNAGIPTTKAISIPASQTGTYEVTVSSSDSGSSTTSGCSINIKAVDSAGKAISGVGFSAYSGTSVSGTAVGTAQTTNNGAATISKLTAGTYTVRATTIPNGYSEPATQEVSVTESAAGSLTFTLQASTVNATKTSDSGVSQTADVNLIPFGAGLVLLGVVAMAAVRKKENNKR